MQTSFPKQYLSFLAKSLSPALFRELCECLVLNKPIRLELSLGDITNICNWVDKLVLNFTVSDKSFKLMVDEGMDNWSSSLKYCHDSDPSAMRFVYLHSDKDVCNSAKILDDNDDDYALGHLFGYPDCCIDSYISWQKKTEYIDPITIITTLNMYDKKVNNYHFPNPFSRYFGAGLFSHFPCSLNCTETKKHVAESIEIVKNYSTVVFHMLDHMESALVIFNKNKGLGLWTSFNKDCDTIYLDKNSFHGQGVLKKYLNDIVQLSCINANMKLDLKLKDRGLRSSCSYFVGSFNHIISI
jgi:hypothetical protein